MTCYDVDNDQGDVQHHSSILPYLVEIACCRNVQGNIQGLPAYQQKGTLGMDAFAVQLAFGNCTCIEVAGLAKSLEFESDSR